MYVKNKTDGKIYTLVGQHLTTVGFVGYNLLVCLDEAGQFIHFSSDECEIVNE